MASLPLTTLPDYEFPPVIEVVCGLQFEPLGGFKATAFGLLWEKFRAEYPTVEQQPRLAKVIERFQERIADEPQVELSAVLPLPRMFFIQKKPCWLLQVQDDRFLHNWRKAEETDIYPHFPEVYKRFWSAWQLFLDFCREEGMRLPEINQLEVTYINHINQGEGWDGPSTVGQVFPDIAWRTQRSFLPLPESVAWRTTFVLPNAFGRLSVSVQHGFRKRDMKPVLLSELTVRGVPDNLDENAIQKWFYLGREWIVRGFADLTSESIQSKVWRRKGI